MCKNVFFSNKYFHHNNRCNPFDYWGNYQFTVPTVERNNQPSFNFKFNFDSILFPLSFTPINL